MKKFWIAMIAGCLGLLAVLGWASPPQQTLSTASVNLSPTRGQLDEVRRRSQESLARIVKKAYIGYLGLERGRLLEDQELIGSADTLFSDINELLKKNVEPLLQQGKRLSETYWQRSGDRTYLDQFAFHDLRVKGLAFSNSEDYRRARTALLQAVSLATRMDDPMGLAHALNNLAYSNFHLGRTGEAVENLERAVRLAETVKDPQATSLFLYNLGWLHLNAHRLELALPILERAATLGGEAALPIRRLAALLNLGYLEIYLGRPQRAEARFAESLQLATEINSLRFRTLSAMNLAIPMVMRGEIGEADRLLERALSIFQQHGHVFMRGEGEFLKQKALRLRGSIREKGRSRPAAEREPVSPPAGSPGQAVHSHFGHLALAPMLFVPSAGPLLQQGGGAVRISMKTVTTPKDTSFTLPVYLATAPNQEISELIFQVTYPKKILSFSAVEKGYLLQSSRFRTAANTAGHPEHRAMQVLKVSVSAAGGNGSALPTGLILYLSFQVPAEADSGTVILGNKILSARTVAGKSLPRHQLAADNQDITVLGEDMVPTIMCFFYIH